MRKFILFITIFTVVFASCKKNKSKDCQATDANFVGKYTVASIIYKASETAPEEDYTNQFLDDCEKDDITTIKSDHTYTYTDAGTICTPNGDYDGTWNLSGNILVLDGDQGTLENFTCNGFSVYATDFQVTGDKISINYSKQ